MIDASALQPHRHTPPDGWPPEVFERVTDALAAALVSAVRRSGVNEAVQQASQRPGPDRQ
jgi:hypothetical protein